ncbi:MAG: hypothetical protein ACR2LF_08010 [Jatrophihabitantaceae bacterium]
MAWALWLSAPILATAISAMWAWWRARPRRRLDTPDAMQAHRDYLDALALGVRGRAGALAAQPRD